MPRSSALERRARLRDPCPVSAINPEELLLAYRLGIFPMAESRGAKDVLWVRPHERGILPLDKFHVPRRLAETVRKGIYEVRINTAFGDVIRGCAEARPGRRETWINDAIIDVFEALHARGLAHSVETWCGGVLAGGLYGLSLGAAFFAESKFSRQRDASKVALVHLAARLKAGGYLLLDAQFPNPHLEQFGAIAIGEEKFQRLLSHALAERGDFYRLEGVAGAPCSSGAVSGPGAAGGGGISAGTPVASPGAVTGSSVLQVITQTS
jgi:leucyl/phenylalanyl-tRNA--protein transferase